MKSTICGKSSPYLKKLLANISDILCVLADKGYESKLNAQLIAEKSSKKI
ncbi:hypothetical protein ACO3TA_05400 [Methanocaldococcus sp. 28A]